MQRALVDTHRRAYDLIHSLDPGALVTSNLAHTPAPMPQEDLRFVDQVRDKLDYLGVDYYYGLEPRQPHGCVLVPGALGDPSAARRTVRGAPHVQPAVPRTAALRRRERDGDRQRQAPHLPLHAGRLHPGPRLLDPAGDRRRGGRDRLQLLEPRRQLRVGQLPGPLRPLPCRRDERPDARTPGNRRCRRLPRGHRRGRCARGICPEDASGVLLVRATSRARALWTACSAGRPDGPDARCSAGPGQGFPVTAPGRARLRSWRAWRR